MQLLKEYFELQAQIFAHFGYVEDWAIIPLADFTEVYWFIDPTSPDWGEAAGGIVTYFKELPTVENIDAVDSYSAEIYTQRHLPKWVYRADGFTMIVIDTRTDGNKFLAVFDNAKEIKDPALREAATEL